MEPNPGSTGSGPLTTVQTTPDPVTTGQSTTGQFTTGQFTTAQRRPNWQLPRGVWTGTWDYLIEPRIATDYDAFHGDHPLMRLDMAMLEKMLAESCPPDGVVADFGCGTARVARRLEQLGYRTLNVDLSRPMLETAKGGVQAPSRSAFLHSNLVELEWLRTGSIDGAACLFSSIGMIRGRENRQSFLKHVCRVLKPGGKLLLHVHNRGHSWLDPQGPWWLISGMLKGLRSKQWEYGDRVYVYRGLPKMFLHIYSRSELASDLKIAGFSSVQIKPINLRGSGLLSPSNPLNSLLAGGYFALASSPVGR